jgi:hypothetical protein
MKEALIDIVVPMAIYLFAMWFVLHSINTRKY